MCFFESELNKLFKAQQVPNDTSTSSSARISCSETPPGAAQEFESNHHPITRSRLASAAQVSQNSTAHRHCSEQSTTIFGAKAIQEAEDRSEIHRAPEEAEQGSGEQDHQLAAEADGERKGCCGAEEIPRRAQDDAAAHGGVEVERRKEQRRSEQG